MKHSKKPPRLSFLLVYVLTDHTSDLCSCFLFCSFTFCLHQEEDLLLTSMPLNEIASDLKTRKRKASQDVRFWKSRLVLIPQQMCSPSYDSDQYCQALIVKMKLVGDALWMWSGRTWFCSEPCSILETARSHSNTERPPQKRTTRKS